MSGLAWPRGRYNIAVIIPIRKIILFVCLVIFNGAETTKVKRAKHKITPRGLKHMTMKREKRGGVGKGKREELKEE